MLVYDTVHVSRYLVSTYTVHMSVGTWSVPTQYMSVGSADQVEYINILRQLAYSACQHKLRKFINNF